MNALDAFGLRYASVQKPTTSATTAPDAPSANNVTQLSPLTTTTTPTTINLSGCCPPITKIDPSFGQRIGSACLKLSLSTNNIDRISGPGLQGLHNLRILSVGRNCIKRLDGIEAIGTSLEQLWVSYNSLEKLVGLDACPHLRVLYASNNRIKDWSEIDLLAKLEHLEDLLLVGNPICGQNPSQGYREKVIQRLPKLKKLDGVLITEEERTHSMVA